MLNIAYVVLVRVPTVITFLPDATARQVPNYSGCYANILASALPSAGNLKQQASFSQLI